MEKFLARDFEERIKLAISENNTMAAASRAIPEISFVTFRKLAMELGLYKPNQGNKGGTKHEANLDNILSNRIPYEGYRLKTKLIEAGLKQNRCECCNLSEWNGQEINLELHHVDGNRYNNSIENVQLLCPNCHSQTPNFRSKNTKRLSVLNTWS